MSATTVLIVDDHEVAREGLRAALANDPDFEIVAAEPNGRRALEAARRTRPDVAIVDLCLPDMPGDELCRELLVVRPGLAVVMLTSYLTEETVRRALHAGASAYVTKAAGLPELRAALNRIRADGPSSHDLTLVSQIVRSQDDIVTARSEPGALTPHQSRVLELVADGLTYKEISERLFISTSTVRFHIQNLKVKFGARTRTELVGITIRSGLIARPGDEAVLQ
jgi:DNA-binding NarL/FixJ family response regulator